MSDVSIPMDEVLPLCFGKRCQHYLPSLALKVG
jgi:hypothetical protein